MAKKKEKKALPVGLYTHTVSWIRPEDAEHVAAMLERYAFKEEDLPEIRIAKGFPNATITS